MKRLFCLLGSLLVVAFLAYRTIVTEGHLPDSSLASPRDVAPPELPSFLPGVSLEVVAAERHALRAALIQAMHCVEPAEASEATHAAGEVAFVASNPVNHLRAHFLESGGIHLQSEKSEKNWQATLSYVDAWGNRVAGTTTLAGEARVEVRYPSGLLEWFENKPQGIEHGFTVDDPAFASRRDEQLIVPLSLQGMQAIPDSDRLGDLIFVDENTQPILAYRELKVWDATGHMLEASMFPSEGGLTIAVNDRGATYPITIDPWIVDYESTEFAPTEGTGTGSIWDRFGNAVAIRGDVAFVAAHEDATAAGNEAGSVYVFINEEGVWTEHARLVASDGAAGDWFGASLAVDGDTLVVGADRADTTAGEDAGAVYVFTQSGGVWTEQAKLEASGTGEKAYFGVSVAIDGDTMVAGAASSLLRLPEGEVIAGRAYVFRRSGDVWMEEAELMPSGSSHERFGMSVSLSGDTALVGSIHANTAHVFHRIDTVWTEQAVLQPSDPTGDDYFGVSVSMDGDRALVGASLHDAGGNNASGAAYLYERSDSVWSEVTKLTASDGTQRDRFAELVLMEGDAIFIGSFEDESGIPRSDSGLVYVYERNGSNWEESAILQATSGRTDEFGFSLAIDEGVLLVGEPGHDGTNRFDAGAANIYTKTASSWERQARLEALPDNSSVSFAFGFELLGDTMLAGAHLLDTDAGASAGKVFVYKWINNAWVLSDTLTASDAEAGDRFGQFIELTEESAFITASGYDYPGHDDAGVVYEFRRVGDAWEEVGLITPNDLETTFSFGENIHYVEGRLLVGTLTQSFGDRVELYEYEGDSWNHTVALEPDNLVGFDVFGSGAVGIDNFLYISAPGNFPVGSIFVFALRDGWEEIQEVDFPGVFVDFNAGFAWDLALREGRLYAHSNYDDTIYSYAIGSDGLLSDLQSIEASEELGYGLDIDGDVMVVGTLDESKVLVFTYEDDRWQETTALIPEFEQAGDFGEYLRVDGNLIVVAPWNAGTLDISGALTEQGGRVSTWTIAGELTSEDLEASPVDGSVSVVAGQPAVMSVTVPEDQIINPVFRWYRGTEGDLENSTAVDETFIATVGATSTLTIPSATEATHYWVSITDSDLTEPATLSFSVSLTLPSPLTMRLSDATSEPELELEREDELVLYAELEAGTAVGPAFTWYRGDVDDLGEAEVIEDSEVITSEGMSSRLTLSGVNESAYFWVRIKDPQDPGDLDNTEVLLYQFEVTVVTPPNLGRNAFIEDIGGGGDMDDADVEEETVFETSLGYVILVPNANWVYHRIMGWTYPIGQLDDGTPTGDDTVPGLWQFIPRLDQWIWTDSSKYPLVYVDNHGWIYVLESPSGGQGWYYDYGTRQWLTFGEG